MVLLARLLLFDCQYTENLGVKHMAMESETEGFEPEGSRALSGMQARVMELLASGLNRRQISEALNISLHTVNTHVERIYRKLGVHNAASAVALALTKEEPVSDN